MTTEPTPEQTPKAAPESTTATLRRIGHGLFLPLTAGLFWVFSQHAEIQPEFRLPPSTRTPTLTTPYQVSDLKAPTAAAHAASIVALPNGERRVFWFAGSREGAGDVAIYTARQTAEGWLAPEKLTDAADTARQQGRFVRKLGNPVPFVDAAGRLHVVYVTVTLGGWATSQLAHRVSTDNGATWQSSRPLLVSPFINLSTLARTPPLLRADGGFDLPVYHESARKFPELLRFDAAGELRAKVRMDAGPHLLQPAVVATGPNTAVTVLRDGGPGNRLHFQQTKDGGQHWTTAEALPTPNPDAAVALARFADGELLLAYNPDPNGRARLALATSQDGRQWTLRRILEQEAGGEFSYPALWVDGTRIDVVYTWKRQHIRHVQLDRQTLNGGTP